MATKPNSCTLPPLQPSVFRRVHRSRYSVRVAAQAFCLLLGLPLRTSLLIVIVFVSLPVTFHLKASGPPNVSGNCLLKRSELQSEGRRWSNKSVSSKDQCQLPVTLRGSSRV